MKNRGFTLAEIMIVLTVIGILTAIILPSARNLMPDRNLMKFKKAHNTLATAITELVNSDKYYLDGDLAKRPNGNLINNNDGDITYFCETFADILNTKAVNCSKESIPSDTGAMQRLLPRFDGDFAVTDVSLDEYCKNSAPTVGNEIKMADGSVFYQTNPDFPFGRTNDIDDDEIGRIFCLPFYSETQIRSCVTDQGFPLYSKGVCIDIDGIPENATVDDCVNECPFGYSLRADGKIFLGARAKEWLAKDETKND